MNHESLMNTRRVGLHATALSQYSAADFVSLASLISKPHLVHRI